MNEKKYPPYLFDVDFDALALPPEPEEVEEAPPPPSFSTEELQAARDAAFEEGKAEGITQTNTGFESQIKEAVSALQGDFAALSSAQRAANETTLRGAVQIAATISAKLLPEFEKRHGLDEIEAFVKSTLSTLFAEAEVVVKAPEALANELATRLVPIADALGLAGKLKVAADPALGPADCRMEWGNGGAERNGEKLLSEIDTTIARFLEHGEIPGLQNEGEPSGVGAEPETVGVLEEVPSEVASNPSDAPAAEQDEVPAAPITTNPQEAAPESIHEAAPDAPEPELKPAEHQANAEAIPQAERPAEQSETRPTEELYPIDVPTTAPGALDQEQAEESATPSPPGLPGAIDTTMPDQNS